MHLGEHKNYSYWYDVYSPALYGGIMKVVSDPVMAQRILISSWLQIFRDVPRSPVIIPAYVLCFGLSYGIVERNRALGTNRLKRLF